MAVEQKKTHLSFADWCAIKINLCKDELYETALMLRCKGTHSARILQAIA